MIQKCHENVLNQIEKTVEDNKKILKTAKSELLKKIQEIKDVINSEDTKAAKIYSAGNRKTLPAAVYDEVQ